jgi:hypothetical protein
MATHTGEKLAEAMLKKKPGEPSSNFFEQQMTLGDFLQQLPSNFQ